MARRICRSYGASDFGGRGFYKYAAPLALGKSGGERARSPDAPRGLLTPGKREASGVRVALAPLWVWQGNIPKGLCHSAQRCPDAGGATLGIESQNKSNPNGVSSTARRDMMQPRWGSENFWTLTQGSLFLATAGLNDGIPLGFSDDSEKLKLVGLA